MEKDSILTGILVAIIVPILGFVIVEYIFELMTTLGYMDYVSTSTSDKRMRTMVLIGICFNLIPLHLFKNKKWNNSMRGVVFPTLLYIGYWMYRFAGGLF